MSGLGPVASFPVASVSQGAPIHPAALYPETPPIRTDAYRFKWRPLTDDAPANIALNAPVVQPGFLGYSVPVQYRTPPRNQGFVVPLDLSIAPPPVQPPFTMLVDTPITYRFRRGQDQNFHAIMQRYPAFAYLLFASL